MPSTTTPLPPRSLTVLREIAQLCDGMPYSPTVRELQEWLGMASTSVVMYHLEKLQALGLVTREPGLARTLRLTEAGRRVLG